MRTVLVGWDGATFSVLDALMNDGTMPFLRSFAASGVRAVLKSTAHPLTPPAWTTLMTGMPPGVHGVFDFVRVDRRADRYTYVLGTSADLASETIWSIAGRHGCQVTCLNFPSMFPAPDIPGFVVPGFVPWNYLARAVRPKELYARIKRIPGFEARELALDWDLERKALQGLPEEEYESWIRFHTARERHWFDIAEMLMREEDCALTAVLFDGVDKLQHLCYHLIDPRQTRQFDSTWARRIRDLCLDYFRQLDGFLEKITALAGPEARVFVASDHGFTSAGSQIFYANVWLEQNGYLKWADSVPMDEERRLTMDGHAGSDTMFDWEGTTACALTASGNGIYIRKATRGEKGVTDAQYPAFRARLIDSLLDFTDSSGQKVIEKVMTREEAFAGPFMANAPDLTLALRDFSFLSVLRADAPLQPRRMPYGTHHPEGIFLGRGPGIRAGESISAFPIVNITPTLLASLGIPAPEAMQGKAEAAAFMRWPLTSTPARRKTGRAAVAPAVPQAEASRTADEEEVLLAKLKALGYLE